MPTLGPAFGPTFALINNAVNVEPTFAADMAAVNLTYDKIDFDAARRDFDVNSLGPMRVAQAFMPNVEHSKMKKVICVTSLAGSFGQLRLAAYRALYPRALRQATIARR